MSKDSSIDFARKNILYHTGKNWPESFKRVNYVLRGNGLWEVRKNKIGTFFTHLFDHELGGFTEEDQEEGFELALPKIPRRLLNETISFFRKLCEDHDFEAYVQIFWDPDKEKYFIHCPDQRVSHGRVEYQPHGLSHRLVLVCEIHSHNSMNAFFSATDNNDEFQRGDRFFGVIGRLNTPSPEMKLSFITGGAKRVYVSVDSLFDDVDFPREWLQRVQFIDSYRNSELYGASEIDDESHDGFVEDEEQEAFVSDAYDQMTQESWIDEGEEDFDTRTMSMHEEYETSLATDLE